MNRLAFLLALASCMGTWAAETPASPTRQRYALLTANMLRGSKNVRWETKTNNMMDENGKPVKNVDGTTGCVDMTGQMRKDGEEYKRPNHNHFVYKCVKGMEEVAACVGSERTKNAQIEVGQNLDVGGFWHKCQNVVENGTVVYTQENSCHDPSGKDLHIGDEFSVANLRFACADGTYKVVGCSYGQGQKLNEGEERVEGELTHVCESKNGNIQYSAKGGDGCERRGKKHKEGETFQENHLNYKCENGVVEITSCYVKEGQELAIGKDVAENGMIHRCYRLGPSVEYFEGQCGGDGAASCEHPPAIPQTSDEVPALGHGMKSPGVSSFSIASNGTPPQPIKLDLNKMLMGQQG